MRTADAARRYAGRIARLVLAMDGLPDAAQEQVVRLVERGVHDYKECYTQSDLARREEEVKSATARMIAQMRETHDGHLARTPFSRTEVEP